jgi:hypothetical protein
VTIGQLAPTSPPANCGNGVPGDGAQPAVNSGNSYVVPDTGGVTSWTLTSWSHNAYNGPSQQIKLKVWRLVSGLTYRAVAHEGPHFAGPGVVNTFAGLNIPVRAGDVLGLNFLGTGACWFAAPGSSTLLNASDAADGDTITFSLAQSNARANVSAVVTPSSSFSLGAIARNKKNGTATLTVNVPNPGPLALGGTGVQAASAGATKAVAVASPGAVSLAVRATGKKKRKLRSKGKVGVSPTITYTPNGGTASSQSTSVKLTKKR